MLQTKVGLSMLYMLSKPFNKMSSQLCKTQTQYIELVDDGTHSLSERRVGLLAKIAKEHELKYSVHAPFADINIASPSRTMLAASMKRLKQSMKHAQDLNAYLWVFHPGSKSGISAFYPGEDWKKNSASIQELHKTAAGFGLTIAMENLPEKYQFLMKTPDDFQRFYSETGLTEIGIVLDTGHANLEGQIQPFLQKLPSKIVHVHISDNHGKFDEHLGLGHGEINWREFTRKLKAIGFSGTVLTESVYDVEETLLRLRSLFS